MPCAYQHSRGAPVTHGDTGCRFAVPEDGLIHFADESWCAFHLPYSDGPDDFSAKPDWDMETQAAIGSAVLAFIQYATDTGSVADLAGVNFPSDISFEPFADPETPFPAISFEDARFPGETDFIETTFSGPASFAGAVFDGDADFIVAQFADGVDFSGAVFRAGFDATEARFAKGADFSGAVFLGPAYFRETQFGGPVDFSNAHFKVPPVFDQAVLPEGSQIAPRYLNRK